MGVMPTLAELVLEGFEPEVEPPAPAEPDVVPLEPTCFAPASIPAPALLPELEPTSVADVVAALTAALPTSAAEALEPWIEPTCQVAVEVEVESLDVERFAPPAPDLAPARDPGACRYCRAPSAPGQAFCEQCGMHLERLEASPPALPDEEAAVRCRHCGASAAGARCPSCGGRLPEFVQ